MEMRQWRLACGIPPSSWGGDAAGEAHHSKTCQSPSATRSSTGSPRALSFEARRRLSLSRRSRVALQMIVGDTGPGGNSAKRGEMSGDAVGLPPAYAFAAGSSW